MCVLFSLPIVNAQPVDVDKNNNDILILLVHPDLKNSKANKALINAVEDLPNVKVIDLYDTPMDVEYYKKALNEAKAVIFQFPFYWASAPSVLKKWCDEIFTSFGQTPVIQKKPLLVVTTTGSEYEAYRAGGRNQFTIDELLRPYQLLANHSGMIWQTPFVVYGVGLPNGEESIAMGAKAYRERIETLLK